MGSTGEPERKRRHFSALSPTSTKKHPFLPLSEEKRIDTAVLEFQNQKLLQQLEAQKCEFSVLESRFSQLKAKQHNHDNTLLVVNKAWHQLVNDLESMSSHRMGMLNGAPELSSSSTIDGKSCLKDGGSGSPEDTFLFRLLETGATDTSSSGVSPASLEHDSINTCQPTKKILKNIVATINNYLKKNDEVLAKLEDFLPYDDSSKQLQKAVSDLRIELKSLRAALVDLHCKHRSLSNEVYTRRDSNVKNKVELKRLADDLKRAVSELEESNCKLVSLKAQRDTAQATIWPVLSSGGKHASGEKAKEKPKDLQDVEAAVEEFFAVASERLTELRNAHEERLDILRRIAKSQASLKDVKHISSSNAFYLLNDQLATSKTEVEQCRALLEKQQLEKDSLLWREKEACLKVVMSEISERASVICKARIADLEKEIERQISEKDLFEIKLEDAAKEPGRRDIIEEFKLMVSSLQNDMDMMQAELGKSKEAALDIHSLRAEVQSLSDILNRKTNKLEMLCIRSSGQISEIGKLQALVLDLREGTQELQLILEMCRRESLDPRDIIDARDSEYRSWAHVQILKSALDEHSLELRVKAANQAEAMSQQRLANAETEIADLRQKLEASQRELAELTETLKSKNEEGEMYLSEIETIGQAYGDVQAQNQHLLEQITERDDYNIKLVLEGVRAKQLQDAFRMDARTMDKELHQVRSFVDFYELKALQIEEQMKLFSDQVKKLSEDGWQSSVMLENLKRRIADLQREAAPLKQRLDECQASVERSRNNVSEIRMQLENERFRKKRLEEDLEVLDLQVAHLNARNNSGSSITEKLQEETRAYEAILKCSICKDRHKEVVIAKCYHLFCHPCIQRNLESRQRRCSICNTSFGPNDVLKVYF